MNGRSAETRMGLRLDLPDDAPPTKFNYKVLQLTAKNIPAGAGKQTSGSNDRSTGIGFGPGDGWVTKGRLMDESRD